ncbi:Glyco_tranf_GTA_type domain containing protein [Candidatus Nanopelagicaceae bacterium]
MNILDSISVIVPTYNRIDYLQETLKAILVQESQDLEIIVVDDCSTDETKEFLINFAKSHEQVKPVFLTSNQGESFAVNVGWKSASKKFIAIVSSDDPPHKDWLKTMSIGMNANPGHGFYYPDRLVINQLGEPLRIELLADWSSKTLYEVLIPIASAGLIIDTTHLPANFVPRDPNVVFPSDLIQMFNLGLFTSGFRIAGALGAWREHMGSFSSATNAKVKAMLFESNVKNWIHSHSTEIQSYGSPHLREAYLYGHLWLIFRKDFSLTHSFFLIIKSSLLQSICKRPRLVTSIATIAIRYTMKRSV